MSKNVTVNASDCSLIGAESSGDLPAIIGPEDLALDPSAHPSRIIVSAHDRRSWSPMGGFFAIDPANGSHRGLSVDWGNAPPRELRPHGIDIARLTDGGTYLFAINHPPVREEGGDEILAFAISGDTLRFDEQRSISDDLLVSPNDLTVLPDGSLFVSNLRDKGSRITNALKFLLGKDWGNVLYIDAATKSARVVFKAPMPNGLLADVGARRLLVAASRAGTLYVVEFNPADGTVVGEPVSKIPIKAGDNITAVPGEPGAVLVASHPSALRFLLHSMNPKWRSPSRIHRVRYSEPAEVSTIFEDDGQLFSAASTGLIHDGHLYLGQVFRAGVLRCRID